jgi:hypothetical protein
VVPLGKGGIDGSPGIDGAGDAAISGEPPGLAPGRPGRAGCRPGVPLGNAGRGGSPGIDAGAPARSGKPGNLHWGMGVNGRLGRLDTCTGLWVWRRSPGLH